MPGTYISPAETGLYYLQSRYYNPEWGRFVNADDTDILSADQGSLIQHNLFAYCLNNPVNMADPSGYCAAQIIGAVSGAILGNLITNALHLTGWKKYALIAGIALAGAAVGVVLGLYIARLSSVVASKIAAAAGGSGTVVIGETMQRVISYANKINAQVYKGLYNYNQIAAKFGPKVANFLGKVDNAKWLLDKMVKGYKIVDIGIDINRAQRSSSYLMEQILSFFYQNKEIVNKIVK